MTIDDQNGLTEVENKWLFCRIKDTLKSIGRLQLNGEKGFRHHLRLMSPTCRMTSADDMSVVTLL